jgi:hypothetical protein
VAVIAAATRCGLDYGTVRNPLEGKEVKKDKRREMQQRF